MCTMIMVTDLFSYRQLWVSLSIITFNQVADHLLRLPLFKHLYITAVLDGSAGTD